MTADEVDSRIPFGVWPDRAHNLSTPEIVVEHECHIKRKSPNMGTIVTTRSGDACDVEFILADDGACRLTDTKGEVLVFDSLHYDGRILTKRRHEPVD